MYLHGILLTVSSIYKPSRKTPSLPPGIRNLFCHLSPWGLFAAVQIGMATAGERALDKTESRAAQLPTARGISPAFYGTDRSLARRWLRKLHPGPPRLQGYHGIQSAAF